MLIVEHYYLTLHGYSRLAWPSSTYCPVPHVPLRFGPIPRKLIRVAYRKRLNPRVLNFSRGSCQGPHPTHIKRTSPFSRISLFHEITIQANDQSEQTGELSLVSLTTCLRPLEPRLASLGGRAKHALTGLLPPRVWEVPNRLISHRFAIYGTTSSQPPLLQLLLFFPHTGSIDFCTLIAPSTIPPCSRKYPLYQILIGFCVTIIWLDRPFITRQSLLQLNFPTYYSYQKYIIL